MLKNACMVLFLAAVPMALNAAPIDEMPPLEQFAHRSYVGIDLCSIQMTMYILSYGRDERKYQESRSCLEDQKSEVAKKYQELKQQLSSNPDSVKALKDYYATWLGWADHIASGRSALVSSSGEKDYQKRSKQLEQDVKAKGRLLALE